MEERMLDPIPKNCPKWAARSFYDPDTGEVFLPAIIGGDSEMSVLLSVGYDGTSCIHDKGHLYVPLSWLEREYPAHKRTFKTIREKSRRHK